MTFRLVLIALMATLLTGWAGDSPTVYLPGASERDDASDIAVIIWAQSASEQKARGAKLAVKYVATYREGARYGATNFNETTNAFTRASSAVVTPGSYIVVGFCVVSLRDVYVEKVIEAEAGQRYFIRCEGRTPRLVKLVMVDR